MDAQPRLVMPQMLRHWCRDCGCRHGKCTRLVTGCTVSPENGSGDVLAPVPQNKALEAGSPQREWVEMCLCWCRVGPNPK